MTLSELADYITTKVNQSETEDLAACKSFLKRRHDMLWRDQLWKDALVEYRVTISGDSDDYEVTSTYLPAKGILLLPTDIDQVLAVRDTLRALKVFRPEIYYRVDYDTLAKSGSACEFMLLPPVVWEFEESETLLASRASSEDNAESVVARLLDSDGVNVTRYAVEMTSAQMSLADSERIDAITKDETAGTISVGLFYGVTCVNNHGEGDLVFQMTNGGAEVLGEITVADGESGLLPYVSGARGLRIMLEGSPLEVFDYGLLGLYGTCTAPANGSSSYDDSGAVGELSADLLATLEDEDKTAAKRQRIRLVEKPSGSVTLRILAKRKPTAFDDDNDEPGITGIENCLIAFATGDMLQRERQYSKAQILFQEGVELLNQLKRVEVVQQAHHTRIIPEDGIGGDMPYTDAFRGYWGKAEASQTEEDMSRSISGTVDLTAGTEMGTVTFVPSVPTTPKSCNLTLAIPDGGENIEVHAVKGTLSQTSVRFILASPIPGDGYQIHYQCDF